MPDPLSALRKAETVGRNVSHGEQVFGPRFGPFMQWLADAVTGGVLTEEPGPVDLLLALSGAFGARKAAQFGMNRLVSAFPDPVPIARDVFALGKGPIGRRQFFYRASGAPARAAEVRASQSPNVLGSVAAELAATPKFPIAVRGRILDRVRKEGELLEALQERYGILNKNLVSRQATSGDAADELIGIYRELGFGGRSAGGGPVAAGIPQASAVADQVSRGTERKYRPAIDLIRRTRTPSRIVETDSPALRRLDADLAKAESAHLESSDRLRAARHKARDRLDPEGTGNIWEVPQGLWKAIDADPAVLKRRGEVDDASKRITDLRSARSKESAKSLALKAAPTDPVEVSREAFDTHRKSRTRPWYNAKVFSEEFGEVTRADAFLLDRISQIGGPIGKVLNGLARAKVQGQAAFRKAVEDAQDQISSELARQLGVEDVVEEVSKTRAAVRNYFKRYGIDISKVSKAPKE